MCKTRKIMRDELPVLPTSTGACRISEPSTVVYIAGYIFTLRSWMRKTAPHFTAGINKKFNWRENHMSGNLSIPTNSCNLSKKGCHFLVPSKQMEEVSNPFFLGGKFIWYQNSPHHLSIPAFPKTQWKHNHLKMYFLLNLGDFPMSC